MERVGDLYAGGSCLCLGGPDGTEHDFLAEVIDDPGALTSLIFRKGYQWPFDIDKVHDGSSLIDILTYRETVMRGRRVFLDFRINQPAGIRICLTTRLADTWSLQVCSA